MFALAGALVVAGLVVLGLGVLGLCGLPAPPEAEAVLAGDAFARGALREKLQQTVTEACAVLARLKRVVWAGPWSEDPRLPAEPLASADCHSTDVLQRIVDSQTFGGGILT